MVVIITAESPSSMQLAEMAGIHASSFADAWTLEVLDGLVKLTGAIVYLAISGDGDNQCVGFAIVRVVLDEAEIITIVASKDHRRIGVGRSIMARVIDDLRRQSCRHLFLEVASTNQAAMGLYQQLGFKISGKRRDYYPNDSGGRDDALIMRCELNQAPGEVF